MHERHVEPTRVHADMVASSERTVEECVEPIVAAVQAIRNLSGLFEEVGSRFMCNLLVLVAEN